MEDDHLKEANKWKMITWKRQMRRFISSQASKAKHRREQRDGRENGIEGWTDEKGDDELCREIKIMQLKVQSDQLDKNFDLSKEK